MVLFSSNVTRSPDTYLTTLSSKKKTEIPYLLIIQGLKSFIATSSHFFGKHFGPFSVKHLQPRNSTKIGFQEMAESHIHGMGEGSVRCIIHFNSLCEFTSVFIFLYLRTYRPLEYKILERSRNLAFQKCNFRQCLNTLRKSPEGIPNVPD